MDALGFPAEDPLRMAAVKARDAVGAILAALAESEPPAPFLSHYRPSEMIAPSRSKPDREPWVWVGKRNARRRRQ
jgi:hypothetical protein